VVSVSRFCRAISGRAIFIASNNFRQQLDGFEAKFVPVHAMKAHGNGGISPRILYLNKKDFLKNFKDSVRKHACSFELIRVLIRIL
jgi:hypothetical protein